MCSKEVNDRVTGYLITIHGTNKRVQNDDLDDTEAVARIKDKHCLVGVKFIPNFSEIGECH